MKPRLKFSLVGVVILALAAVCFAADTQERVAPPLDQDAMHLSIVTASADVNHRRVLQWFQEDDGLSAMRRTTHFHDVRAGSEMYNARYKPNIKGLPTIRLQDAKGVVLCEIAGADIPDNHIQPPTKQQRQL